MYTVGSIVKFVSGADIISLAVNGVLNFVGQPRIRTNPDPGKGGGGGGAGPWSGFQNINMNTRPDNWPTYDPYGYALQSMKNQPFYRGGYNQGGVLGIGNNLTPYTIRGYDVGGYDVGGYYAVGFVTPPSVGSAMTKISILDKLAGGFDDTDIS